MIDLCGIGFEVKVPVEPCGLSGCRVEGFKPLSANKECGQQVKRNADEREGSGRVQMNCPDRWEERKIE